MSDKATKVTEIKGTIEMADGTLTHFSIGEDYGWTQSVGMKANLENLGDRVAVLDAIVKGLLEDEGGDFTFASANDTDEDDEPEPEEGDEDEFEPEATYKIVRYFRGMATPNKTMRTGLTLAEAQAHCSDPKTESADGGQTWFEGFTKEA